MTAITREHLELAALAAGHFVDPGLPPQVLVRTYRDGDETIEVYREWRPHTDIADAARLAVRLGIIVQPQLEHDVCHAWPTGSRGLRVDARQRIRHDGTEPDKLRAYCEAITLCAAEIGRPVPPPGEDPVLPDRRRK